MTTGNFTRANPSEDLFSACTYTDSGGLAGDHEGSGWRPARWYWDHGTRDVLTVYQQSKLNCPCCHSSKHRSRYVWGSETRKGSWSGWWVGVVWSLFILLRWNILYSCLYCLL